ncbi:MAG: MerR family transcriptional regulator [Clostridium sp.]
MMTVNEVSRLTGVSIRTLQYYDKMGLLKPTEHAAAGYRLYDNRALEKLQQILLFRELEFSLKDIKRYDAPGFDRQKALSSRSGFLY